MLEHSQARRTRQLGSPDGNAVHRFRIDTEQQRPHQRAIEAHGRDCPAAAAPSGSACAPTICPLRAAHGRPSSMQLSPTIFKAYDIRGVVPATSTKRWRRRSGSRSAPSRRAEGEKSRGRGARRPPERARRSARRWCAGLVASGVDVIDIGPATTPMLYFAASTLCSSGIQVTGSHNPKDYNGFKMVLAGRAIYGEEIQALRRLMEAGRAAPRRSPGSVRNVNVLAPYRDRILQDVKLARPLKIVVDSRQRHRRRLGARHLPRARLRGGRALQRSRRQLSQPPPRPEQAGEPEGPDRRDPAPRRRTGPGLRRRRRPAGHHHARRQQHLPGPPDDAVRPRRAERACPAAPSCST